MPNAVQPVRVQETSSVDTSALPPPPEVVAKEKACPAGMDAETNRLLQEALRMLNEDPQKAVPAMRAAAVSLERTAEQIEEKIEQLADQAGPIVDDTGTIVTDVKEITADVKDITGEAKNFKLLAEGTDQYWFAPGSHDARWDNQIDGKLHFYFADPIRKRGTWSYTLGYRNGGLDVRDLQPIDIEDTDEPASWPYHFLIEGQRAFPLGLGAKMLVAGAGWEAGLASANLALHLGENTREMRRLWIYAEPEARSPHWEGAVKAGLRFSENIQVPNVEARIGRDFGEDNFKLSLRLGCEGVLVEQQFEAAACFLGIGGETDPSGGSKLLGMVLRAF